MPLRIPLRAVLYKEQGRWLAHCLELDLIGDATTKAAALESLTEAIKVQYAATKKYKNPENFFMPADGRYFRMFAAGKSVVLGEMHLPTEVEEFQAREYTENKADSDADLVTA
jgi:hypothetical protein